MGRRLSEAQGEEGGRAVKGRGPFFRRRWVGRRWELTNGSAVALGTSTTRQVFEYVMDNAWKSVHDGYRRVQQWNEAHPTLTPAAATLTLDQWMQLVRLYRWRCAYCDLRPTIKYQSGLLMEHMVPLSRGGDHTSANVVPACLSCNSRKANLTPMEWLAVRAGLWRNRSIRDHVRRTA